MEYFDDNDYVPLSPGLSPVQPTLSYSSPWWLPPLWLPKDLNECPLNPVIFDYESHGLHARRQLYNGLTPSQLERMDSEFAETVLLHQMAPTNPQLTLALGLSGPLESMSVTSEVSEELQDISIRDETPRSDLSEKLQSNIRNLHLQINSMIGDGSMTQSARTPPFRDEIPSSDLSEKLQSSIRNLHLQINSMIGDGSMIQNARTPPYRDETPPRRAHNPRKTRLGLPITLNTRGSAATVLACADTGADENIISEELVKALGQTGYESLSEKKKFKLANGKIVGAIGKIESSCSFGVETETSVTMACMFYVLAKVATPIIMGMGFLEETKTMTNHRERLVRVPRPAFQALSVCSVGRPRLHMLCDINHELTMATPDSGSEVDLVSPQFALDRGFEIYPEQENVELADGSIVVSNGFIRTTISIGNHFDSMHAPRSKVAAAIDFMVLDGLSHDVIVGEHYLEELRVFSQNKHALVLATHVDAPTELNRIRCLGAIDKSVAWIKDRLNMEPRRNTPPNGSTGALVSDGIDDQRENARREREAIRIAALPSNEQAAAIAAEDARQRLYDVNIGAVRLPLGPTNTAIQSQSVP